MLIRLKLLTKDNKIKTTDKGIFVIDRDAVVNKIKYTNYILELAF